MTNLSGIYPPIPTPFTTNEQLALDQLAANVQRWLAQPLDGLVTPGSNSEAAFLTPAEKLAIWNQCGTLLRGTGKQLIAGTGAETTAETIALTQAAAAAGATAALVITPSFFKAAMTHSALVAHFQQVADAAPIPILVYNVPAFTGIDLTPATILALAEHPRIVGMKDSSANVSKVAQVLAAQPQFQVFSGSGSALLPFLSIGAVGGIMALANIAAVPLRRMLDAFAVGDLATARRVQLALVELNTAITARYGVPGLKYALDQLGWYGGPSRRPLQPLSDAARADLDRLLHDLRAMTDAA